MPLETRRLLLEAAERIVLITHQVAEQTGLPLPPGPQGWELVFGSQSNMLVDVDGIKLPEPKLVRRVLSNRRARAEFFERTLFSDPAWDMLLDLTAAKGERKRISVSSLCIASEVPPTTALRWVGVLEREDLVARHDDPADRRRAYVDLTEQAAHAIARYFHSISGARLTT